jgi:hypothetical protein
MKKFPFGKVAVATVIPLLGCLLLASAQENADKKAPDAVAKKGETREASRFHYDVDPDLPSPSSVMFKHDGRQFRVVGINPQAKTSKNPIKGLRFHKIMGALAERDTPIEAGMPNIIDGIRRNPDGSVWLRFRVIVSTPEFRKRCRDAVLAQERELLREERLTQDDIRIEPWPLKHCVVYMQDSFSKEIVAVSQTGALLGTKDEFNFTMQFSPEELIKILGLIRKGELEFVYSYSYIGSTVYIGSVDLKGVKNAKLFASQKLRSEQIDGKEPIFQAEATEAIRHLSLSVQKTMRVAHKELIPLLDLPNLYKQLFADDGQINFKDLKAGDEKVDAMLAAYLKPHLEQVRESYTGEKSEITIHEDKVGEGEKGWWNLAGQVGVTIPIKMIPLSLGFGGGLGNDTTKSKEVLKRVENATGSKWGYDKVTERFRPHTIQKVKFQSGADNVLIDEKTTVFLSVGAANRYLEDTAIPVTFTSKSAGASSIVIPHGDHGPYEGVPVGAMVPFFGAKVPKGYVWADGQASFPIANWVPKHLRGVKVPDMRDNLVGGAMKQTDVGIVYDKGVIRVPGSHFGLGEPSVRELGSMTGPSGNTVSCLSYTIGPKEVNHAESEEKSHHYVLKTAEGGRYHMQFKAVQVPWKTYQYTTVTGTAPVTLNTKETQPRHVMCHWIIRVE